MPWTLTRWLSWINTNATATQRTAWQPVSDHPVLGPNAGVLGDSAKRQAFTCGKCGTHHEFLNITLLRFVLQAIATGETEIWLGRRLGGSARND
jgi:hypothetical protein